MPNAQKKYKVTIRATITKDVVVKAENVDAAVEVAHELFDTGCDGMDEHYEQETIGTIAEVNE